MLLLQVSDAVMCRAFPTTLRKAAQAWFKSLRPRSIHSFTQLSDLFQKHFVSNQTRRKNSASLLIVVQERNERYFKRFNAATLEIDNLDESVKYTAFMRGRRPTSKFAFAIQVRRPLPRYVKIGSFVDWEVPKKKRAGSSAVDSSGEAGNSGKTAHE
ncbi:hypothetical protein RJ639_013769 [Escallonia herrerae]|uniref:Retrotransposon gag domain-containing protein n=1 Tax=Escallonia herrerae TaxID=1293975 RepID=A0AA89AN78_9ASTE|nr:hypothetical protein RJ639_013769 [Escallonia herrerae]